MSRVDISDEEKERLGELLEMNRSNKGIWIKHQNRDEKGRFVGEQ